MEKIDLKFYAVRNKEGKFFRRKGFSGYGTNWVDGLDKATIYPKQGQAKSRITFFAKNYPEYGIPELVELRVTEMVVVEQESRVKDVIAKEKKLQEQAVINRKKRNFELAKKEYEEELARV